MFERSEVFSTVKLTECKCKNMFYMKELTKYELSSHKRFEIKKNHYKGRCQKSQRGGLKGN